MAEASPAGSGAAPVPIPSVDGMLRIRGGVGGLSFQFEELLAGASALDGIRGVGPARKRALLRHFGSPEKLVAASREELEAVPGVPGKLAREIHRQLNRAG